LFCPKCGATDPDIETCIPPDYEDMKCNVCGYVGEPRVFWIDGHFTTDDAQERIRRENEVNTPKPV